MAHDEWTILNVGRDAPSRFRAARISTTIRRGPWSPARSAPASARHSALPSRSCVFAHGSSPSTGTSVPSANSIEREHDATARRASALRSERVGVRATAAEARIAFASARAFSESRRPRIDLDVAEEEVLEASEEDARESLSSDDAFAPMTRARAEEEERPRAGGTDLMIRESARSPGGSDGRDEGRGTAAALDPATSTRARVRRGP